MKHAFALALLGSLAVACGGGSRACRVAADCASGVCRTDGTCSPVAGGSTGTVDGGSTTDSGTIDAGGEETDAGPGQDAGQEPNDAGNTGCQLDGDATIGRDEVVLEAGLHATFRVAQNTAINTAGQPLPDGGRYWDLTGALSGDQNVRVDTTGLDGTWFGADFSGATYTSQLSQSSDLLGVFEATSTGLLLRGVVSPTSGPYQTELSYSPPVPVLSFPLTPGATWTVNATVSGLAQGVYVTYFESYQSTVDARGTLGSPFATFPVLRVRTELTRTVGALVTGVRSYLFVSDCFGTVATITSGDNEPQQEFSQAAEVRRLAP